MLRFHMGADRMLGIEVNKRSIRYSWAAYKVLWSMLKMLKQRFSSLNDCHCSSLSVCLKVFTIWSVIETKGERIIGRNWWRTGNPVETVHRGLLPRDSGEDFPLFWWSWPHCASDGPPNPATFYKCRETFKVSSFTFLWSVISRSTSGRRSGMLPCCGATGTCGSRGGLGWSWGPWSRASSPRSCRSSAGWRTGGSPSTTRTSGQQQFWVGAF